MADAALVGIHHVKFPVTDLARSRAWYEKVFGLTPSMEFPDDDGVVKGVGYEPIGPGVTISLRENPQAARGIAGFDPVSFAIADRAAADAWVARLDELGVAHSPVIVASIGWLVVFHDPDGTELHLYSMAEHGIDQSGRPGYGRRVGPVTEAAR
jgi:catechol 2,3-dioxygenase-like lactoylglutathione lyase family enzyme